MPAACSSKNIVVAPGNSRVIRKTVQPNSKFPVNSFLFFMHALCAHAQIYSKYKTDCPVLSWNVSLHPTSDRPTDRPRRPGAGAWRSSTAAVVRPAVAPVASRVARRRRVDDMAMPRSTPRKREAQEAIRVIARFRPLVEHERQQKLAGRRWHGSADGHPAVEFLDDGNSVGLDGSHDQDSDSDRR